VHRALRALVCTALLASYVVHACAFGGLLVYTKPRGQEPALTGPYGSTSNFSLPAYQNSSISPITPQRTGVVSKEETQSGLCGTLDLNRDLHSQAPTSVIRVFVQRSKPTALLTVSTSFAAASASQMTPCPLSQLFVIYTPALSQSTVSLTASSTA